MKRFSVILLILALMLSFAACAKPGTPGNTTTTPSVTVPSTTLPSPGLASPSMATPSMATASPSTALTSPSASATYKDGTYTAKADAWDYGQEDATVTVKNGKISDVKLRRLNKDGTEVDYKLFDGKTHDGKVYPNLKEFKDTMAKRMVDQQKANVDIIAGATVSTKNWTVAATRALDKAK